MVDLSSEKYGGDIIVMGDLPSENMTMFSK